MPDVPPPSSFTVPMQGGCRCGEVRFEVAAAPMITSVCHCRGCQQMTGSAYSTTVTVPSSAFSVTEGAPVLGGLRGPHARHHHCPACLSWVFTRVEPDQGFVNVRATQLDDPSRFRPFVEMYTSEKLPWAETGAQRSYSRFPEMSEYPVLLKAYADHVKQTGAEV